MYKIDDLMTLSLDYFVVHYFLRHSEQTACISLEVPDLQGGPDNTEKGALCNPWIIPVAPKQLEMFR